MRSIRTSRKTFATGAQPVQLFQPAVTNKTIAARRRRRRRRTTRIPGAVAVGATRAVASTRPQRIVDTGAEGPRLPVRHTHLWSRNSSNSRSSSHRRRVKQAEGKVKAEQPTVLNSYLFIHLLPASPFKKPRFWKTSATPPNQENFNIKEEIYKTFNLVFGKIVENFIDGRIWSDKTFAGPACFRKIYSRNNFGYKTNSKACWNHFGEPSLLSLYILHLGSFGIICLANIRIIWKICIIKLTKNWIQNLLKKEPFSVNISGNLSNLKIRSGLVIGHQTKCDVIPWLQGNY